MKRDQSLPTTQLTVRGVPARVKELLFRRARKEQKSLNTVLVEALSLAAGVTEEARFADLDELSGLWQDDPEFQKALEAQDRIDQSVWQ